MGWASLMVIIILILVMILTQQYHYHHNQTWPVMPGRVAKEETTSKLVLYVILILQRKMKNPNQYIKKLF